MQIKNNVIENEENINWNKISIISFFFCIMVVFIHIPYEIYTDEVAPVLIWFAKLITNLIPTIAVPGFFMVSGMLFYRNYTYCETWKKYKSRFKSLVIPFVFWNCIGVLWWLACTYIPFVSKISEINYSFNIINIILGIFTYQCNKVFWFVQNLILYTLLCPIIFTLLRNR